jgi:signal transduction histidine kinase/CheY-like chemotaxis protein
VRHPFSRERREPPHDAAPAEAAAVPAADPTQAARDPSADQTATTLIELTERLMAEVSVRERAERRQAARYEAERALNEGVTTVDMARRVITELCRLLDWDGGSFWWHDEATLVCVDGVARKPADRPIFWRLAGTRIESNQGLPGRVWTSGRADWHHGPLDDEALAGLHGPCATSCAFCIPVDGTNAGVILLVSRAPLILDEALLGDFDEIGQALGRAVERRTASEHLRIATSRLSTLVANLSGAILLEDESRRIVLVNRPYVDLFAIDAPPEKLVGEDGSLLVELSAHQLADPDEFARGVDEVLGRREPDLARTMVLADGRVLERDFLPVVENDRRLGYLWHYRDVTARVRYEGELRDARERAEAGTRAKSAFLATMSHEIRTPLNAVVNMTELLLDSPLNDDQARLARAAGRAGRALAEIVNDVLDFSKIEAGQLSLESIPFDLVELLHDIADAYTPIAAQRGLALETDLADGLPWRLSGDPLRIRQVITNLVGNALKFTRQGSITLGLREADRGPGWFRFWVRDTGIGISDEARSRLFRAFSQADSSTTREFGGTGLGLAISRELVERMGGQIEVDSEPGQGSEFWFEVPFEILEQTAPEPATTEASGQDGSRGGARPRILVAEDNELNRDVIAALLRRYDAEVVAVPDGRAAVDRLAVESFDLVLMDCQMPVLDGLSAAREVRLREAGGPRVPIVALTADARIEARRACEAAGMDDYLAKPIERTEMDRVFARWLQVAPLPASARRPAGTSPGAPTRLSRASAGRAPGPSVIPSSVLDIATFRTMEEVVGVGRFAQVLLDNLDRLCERAETALATLAGTDLLRELAAVGHAVTGVAAQAGARELEALGREIERIGRSEDASDLDGRAGRLAPAVERLRLVLAAEASHRHAA